MCSSKGGGVCSLKKGAGGDSWRGELEGGLLEGSAECARICA